VINLILSAFCPFLFALVVFMTYNMIVSRKKRKELEKIVRYY